MTEALPEALATSISSTLQHIARLREKEAKLARAIHDSLSQVLHRLGMAHRSGEITDEQLLPVFQEISDSKIPGRKVLWDELVDVNYGQMLHVEKRLPNGPNGSWVGEYPFAADAPTPWKGVSVVYVLFDADNVPCYVGSTLKFRLRLAQHNKDGKRFVRWSAYRCKDRDDAYRLETQLLQEHKPYLNRRSTA